MVPQTAHNVYVCVGWGGGGIMCVCEGGAQRTYLTVDRLSEFINNPERK